MRIQGRLDLIQSNLDFYSRLTSTSKLRKVEDLRSYYYSRFLDDAKRSLKSIVSSRTKVEEEGKLVESSIEEPIVNVENEDCVEEVKKEFTAGGFLDAVQNLKNKMSEEVKPVGGICLEDIIEGTGFEIEEAEEVHGTFLEDIGNTSHVESTSLEVHGTYLEDVEVIVSEITTAHMTNIVEVAQEQPEVHGTYLEDVVVSVAQVVQNPITPSNFTYEESGEDEDLYQGFDEPIQETEFIDTSNIIPINEGVIVQEVVNVPHTVREFLKSHPGSPIIEVEKYYPKKVIDKEIKMGKIYKKGSKLFI